MIVAGAILIAVGWMAVLFADIEGMVAEHGHSSHLAAAMLAGAIGIVLTVGGATLGTIFLGLNIWGYFLVQKWRLWYVIIGTIMLGWSSFSIYNLLAGI